MDSSEPIPDSLIAILIKLWLLLSRAEGLEAKYGKQQITDEYSDKGSKKDERVKTPIALKKPVLAKSI